MTKNSLADTPLQMVEKWEKKVSNQKVQNRLIKNQLIENESDFIDLNVIDRGFSGRVTKLEIKDRNLNKRIVLEKDEVIRLPFGREIIEIIIKDCTPENIVSMNEIEELELDFE